jgi:3-mercaptopyruvate sulfurtransferase SseA
LISRRIVSFATIGVLVAVALGAWSCGGSALTTGYTDPFAAARTPSAVIDAATLGQWTDEGRVNAPLGTAGRVVVVSVASAAAFTSTARKHIPDAFNLDYASELTMTREEGLGPAIQMMLSGPRMDGIVQKLGIDAATIVVLTIPRGSTDLETYQQSVAYWTFRYWGFSRDRVKILNGGDDAWDAAGRALTDAILVPARSTYTVSGNKILKDSLRTSAGEMLAFVDSVNRDRSLLNTWQMLDVRGFGTFPYVANAYRGSSAMQFLTERVNGEPNRNRLYPTADRLASLMASSPVLDGATPTFLSPGKKMLVMCFTSTSASPTFVLFDAVLGVPEGDVTMYDASAVQWNTYTAARIRAAGATPAQAATWAFDAITPGTEAPRAVGTFPAAAPGENPFVPGNFAYSPLQDEANQPETADKAYMAQTNAGGGGGTPGGGGGGSTGGC